MGDILVELIEEQVKNEQAETATADKARLVPCMWFSKCLNSSDIFTTSYVLSSPFQTKSCLKFYKDKTNSRIDEYFKRFNNSDSDKEVINGTKVPSIKSLLDSIEWGWISDGVSVRFHGDLHFENILINETVDGIPFSLLDWRQNFNGEYEYGDIYYDLAKLYHGLIISHDFINQNFYNYTREMNYVYYDFHRKNTNIECERILEKYVKERELDWSKVKIITALIFLNIAGLHHYPYCHLLFYLGKNLLYKGLRGENGIS